MAFQDPAVARVLRALLDQRGRRLFAVAGHAIGSDEVNATLAEWAGSHVTAKDFRTWHGTRIAFETVERAARRGHAKPEETALEAVDAAAESLGNTRAVARTSYVHPQLLDAVLDGTFDRLRPARTPRSPTGLTASERRLRVFLASAWTDLPLTPPKP
jgi:DNA topoisomerase-1